MDGCSDGVAKPAPDPDAGVDMEPKAEPEADTRAEPEAELGEWL
jgi:hypothetical protein